jgi:16S rRNA G527 N7-methylase RsmG
MAACVPAAARYALDLGSGGGVPGLVLAGARPETSFVLLEAGLRRCRFLREAVDELGLEVGSVAVAVIKSTTVVVERPAATTGNRGRTSS